MNPSNDLVCNLLETPFGRLTDENKRNVLLQGRPTAILNIGLKKELKKSGRSYNVNFKSSWFSEYNWLCSSTALQKLFCWSCLLFSNKYGVWNGDGFTNLLNITRALRKHQKSKEHLTCQLRFRNFEQSHNTIADALEENATLYKLEEDMENYVKFKLMGGIKKLKPNVVPHIFDCQLDVRLPTLSAESTTTSSKDDSSSIQMDQNNTIYSVQVLSDVNESPKQSTIAVMETCVKTEEEDASFYHSNQPALYNLVETEMNGEIDNEIDVKYQPFTISLDQIKEEIDIDDYNSPSVTHQLKKRKSSHQSAYEAIDQSSRTESDTHIHNPVEDIQKDEWYHFGNNIACQLRNLSLERALMCQQKIIEILTQERIDFITKMKTEDTNTTKED